VTDWTKAEDDTMRLEDAKVLITGGATGIGLATALAMRDGGARVAVCGRRQEPLDRARDQHGLVAIQGDIANAADARRITAAAIEAHSGLNLLINNAAVGYYKQLLEIDPAEMARVFAINVVGTTLMAQACAAHFVENGGGTIVNVGSTASNGGYPGGSTYAGTKFALNALTQCWRAELRKHDVRVMQVNPSEVQTEFGGRVRPEIDPTRLVAGDCAHLIVSLVTLADRGFVTDATLWATNPR
jgi:3-oxoacyl-[acyl-carrier protein] reductase